MTIFLKQSTAIDVRLGPFVDVGDGFTPETGVTIGASDEAEILKANGAATVAMTGAFAAVTSCDGWYDYTLAAGDVDTVGELVIVMQDDSVYLPVHQRFYVVEEAVYDAMYGASAVGPLQSTVAARTLDVSAGGEAGIDWANVGTPGSTVGLSATTVGTVTANTDMRGTDNAALASVLGALADAAAAGDPTSADTVMQYVKQLINTLEGAVGIPVFPAEAAPGNNVSLAEVIRAMAVDVAGLNGDVMRGTDGVDTATMRGTDSAALASVATEARLSELDAATGGKAANQIDLIKTEADKIALVDAGVGVAGSVIEEVENRALASVATEARLAELDAANLPTDVANVQSDTDDIQTRLPAALVGGAMDADVSVIQTDAVSAAAMSAAAAQKIRDEILPTQNAAFSNLEFLFVAASDHVTPVTGASGTAVTRSIDGGAFGSGTGTLAEVGNGIYQYDASAADMNGGTITFRFTGTGGTPGAPDDAFVTVVTGGGV